MYEEVRACRAHGRAIRRVPDCFVSLGTVLKDPLWASQVRLTATHRWSRPTGANSSSTASDKQHNFRSLGTHCQHATKNADGRCQVVFVTSQLPLLMPWRCQLAKSTHLGPSSLLWVEECCLIFYPVFD